MFQINAQLNLTLAKGAGTIGDDIKRQFKDLNLKIDINVSDKSKRDVAELAKNFKVLRGSLKALNAEALSTIGSINKLTSSMGSAASATAEFAGASKKTVSSQREVNSALKEGQSFAEQFGTQIGLATRRFAAFTSGTIGMFALVGALRSGIKEAIAFDLAMNKLRQVADDGGKGVDELKGKIQDLAKGLGVSSIQLAEAATAFTQAGLNAKEAAKAVDAFALSLLTPNFGNAKNTIEGMIALYQQFGKDAGKLREQLGSINAVAGAFASEAEDLVTAIQKAGGVFSTTGGSLNELLAIMTSVRSTTRESADTIATGLRSIFTYVQRTETVDALKQLNIQLRYTKQEAEALGDVNLEDQFVKPYEAIQRLSVGLAKLRSTDPRYSQIVEDLGGVRQVSRVLPLIQQFSEAQKALNVARVGSASIENAAAIRQDAVATRLTKVRETYQQLSNDLIQSKGFKAALQVVLDLSTGIADLTKNLTGLIPVISGLALGFGSKFAIGATGAAYKAFSTPHITPIKRSSGGPVPGHGNGDTVPAYLEGGEYVLRKAAVQKIGRNKLDKMNRDGVAGYADGGQIPIYSGNKRLKNYPPTISNIISQIENFGIDPTKLTNSIVIGKNSTDRHAKNLNIEGGYLHTTRDILLNNNILQYKYRNNLNNEYHALLAHEFGHGLSNHINGKRILNGQDMLGLATRNKNHPEYENISKITSLLKNVGNDYLDDPEEKFADIFGSLITDSLGIESKHRKVPDSARQAMSGYLKYLKGIKKFASGGRFEGTSGSHINGIPAILHSGRPVDPKIVDHLKRSLDLQNLNPFIRKINFHSQINEDEFSRGSATVSGFGTLNSVNDLSPFMGAGLDYRDHIDEMLQLAGASRQLNLGHHLNRYAFTPLGSKRTLLNDNKLNNLYNPRLRNLIGENNIDVLSRFYDSNTDGLQDLVKSLNRKDLIRYIQKLVKSDTGQSSRTSNHVGLSNSFIEHGEVGSLIADELADQGHGAHSELFREILEAGNKYRRYASGGPVFGGTPGKDSVNARLMPGEYVIKQSSASKIGKGALDHLNEKGELPQGFAKGGRKKGDYPEGFFDVTDSGFNGDEAIKSIDKTISKIIADNLLKSANSYDKISNPNNLFKVGFKDPNELLARAMSKVLSLFPKVTDGFSRLNDVMEKTLIQNPHAKSLDASSAEARALRGLVSGIGRFDITKSDGSFEDLEKTVGYSVQQQFRDEKTNRRKRKRINPALLPKSVNTGVEQGVENTKLNDFIETEAFLKKIEQDANKLDQREAKTKKVLDEVLASSNAQRNHGPLGPQTGRDLIQERLARIRAPKNQIPQPFTGASSGSIDPFTLSSLFGQGPPSPYSGLSIREVARQSKIPRSTLQDRLKRGMTIDQAVAAGGGGGRRPPRVPPVTSGSDGPFYGPDPYGEPEIVTDHTRRIPKYYFSPLPQDKIGPENTLNTYGVLPPINRGQSYTNDPKHTNPEKDLGQPTYGLKPIYKPYVYDPNFQFNYGTPDIPSHGIPNPGYRGPKPEYPSVTSARIYGFNEHAEDLANKELIKKRLTLGDRKDGTNLLEDTSTIKSIKQANIDRQVDQLAKQIERQLKSTDLVLKSDQRYSLARELAAKALEGGDIIGKDRHTGLPIYGGRGIITDEKTGKVVGSSEVGQLITNPYVDQSGRGRFGRFKDRIANNLSFVNSGYEFFKDNRLSRGLQGLSQRTGVNSTGAAIGLSTVASLAGDHLTPDQKLLGSQVAAGQSNRYTNEATAGGALQGAAFGASAGIAFGPWGAAIGGVIGGLVGFTSALKQARIDVENAKIDNALEKIGGDIKSVSSGRKSLAEINESDLVSNIRQARLSATQIAAEKSTSTFRGFNPKLFEEESKKQLRIAFGGQAGEFAASISEEINKDIKKGKGFEEIVKSFQGGSRGSLFSTVTQVRGISSQSALKELEEDVKAGIRNNQAFKASQKGEDTVNKLSSSFGRLVQSVENAASVTEQFNNSLSILGGGIGKVSGLSAGISQFGAPFGNEFGTSLRGINRLIGPNANQLTGSANAANQIQRVLPEILAEVASQPFDEKNTESQRVLALLERRLDSKNPDISAGISVVLRGLSEESRKNQGDTLRDARVDSTAFSKQLLEPFTKISIEAAKSIAKDFEKVFNDQITGFDVLKNRKLESDQQGSRSLDLGLNISRARADLVGSRLGGVDGGRLLSLEQLIGPVNQKQSELLEGLDISNVNDPKEIGEKLKKINERRLAVGEKRDELLKGGFKESANAASKEFADLTYKSDRLKKALETLIDPTLKLAAIQEKLSHLNADRDARLSFGERFINASGSERLEIARGQKLVSNLAQDPESAGKKFLGLSADNQRLALREARSIGDGQFKNGLTGNSLANLLIGSSGVLNQGNEAERQALLEDRIKITKEAKTANDVLTKILKGENNQFLDRLEKSFDSFLDRLSINTASTNLSNAENKLRSTYSSTNVLNTQKNQADLLRSVGIGFGNNPEEIDNSLKVAKLGTKQLDEYFSKRDAYKPFEGGETFFNENYTKQIFGASSRLTNEAFKDPNGRIDPTNLTRQQISALFSDVLNQTSLPEELKPGIIGSALPRFGEARVRVFNRDRNANQSDVARTAISELLDDTSRNFFVGAQFEKLGQLNKAKDNIKPFGFNPEALYGADPGKIKNALDAFSQAGQSLGSLPQRIKDSDEALEKLRKTVNELQQSLDNLRGVKRTPSVFGIDFEYKSNGGPMARGTDIIPAMLSPNEYVVNAKSAAANRSLLEKINSSNGATITSQQLFERDSPFSIPMPNTGQNELNDRLMARGGPVYLADGGQPNTKPTGFYRFKRPRYEFEYQTPTPPGLEGDIDLRRLQDEERRRSKGEAVYPDFNNKEPGYDGTNDKGQLGGKNSGEYFGITEGRDRSKPKTIAPKPRKVESKEDIYHNLYPFSSHALDKLNGASATQLRQFRNRGQLKSLMFQQALVGTQDQMYIAGAERVKKQSEKDLKRFDEKFGQVLLNSKKSLLDLGQEKKSTPKYKPGAGVKSIDYGSGKGIPFGTALPNLGGGTSLDKFGQPPIGISVPKHVGGFGKPKEDFSNKGAPLFIGGKEIKGFEFKKFANGGVVTGGIPGQDSVPALLTPGEVVVPNKQGNNSGSNPFEKLTAAIGAFAGPSDKLTSAFTVFSDKSEALAAALDRFPREITHTGNFNVNVNHNGAEVFSQLDPTIKKLVVSEAMKLISQEFERRLPEASSGVRGESSGLS